ncbi:hypothetical protein PCANC_09653 [Puccinia coronata f. sp. avenae]|uniref:DNA 3'-5' helicase n=1 Tax=Puccinia coronata f. sp. avenae TaxID=200324 RepID=A0A2N5VAR2_9BASI|nr:hypothetical protein PCANC_09653 [Puccinia coronata f. sp. avenae]
MTSPPSPQNGIPPSPQDDNPASDQNECPPSPQNGVPPPSPQNAIAPPLPMRLWSPAGVNLYKKLFNMSDEKLTEHIIDTSFNTYGQAAKELQVSTVMNLARGRSTFLLAGTGFGKSRISEMYYDLIPKKSKGVVLVLNPLDTLGNNQVLEKVQAGFTAINLTKLTFNTQAATGILRGDYNFVYLSPEIFLNSKMFQGLYYSAAFQNRIALIVIDEAHMIYIWGIVESGPANKTTSSHLRHEDSGLFRPLYGKLGAQLLFRNEKPLLLLSATCRPMATAAIMKSLKLTDTCLDMIHGKLVRPEIRILRIPMSKSLSSSLDVIKLLPLKGDKQWTELARPQVTHA